MINQLDQYVKGDTQMSGESSKQRVHDLTFDTDASKMETKGYKGSVQIDVLEHLMAALGKANSVYS